MNERRRTLLFSGKFVDHPTKNGVWIETIEHKYCLPDDWDSEDNESANSIAVVTDEHRFRIALQGASSKMMLAYEHTYPWEIYLSGTTNSGITNSTVAKLDYNGASNTQLIIEKCQSATTFAAGWCDAYTFPDGVTKGYMPALGELYLAYQNKAAIDAALAQCGGTAILTNREYHWSSTFYGASGNFRTFWILAWDNSRITTDGILDYHYYVRAFGALEDSN